MSLSWGIVIVVTVISVVIAMYAARGKQGSGITSDEDFLVAGRDLGSFAAACTLVATYWSGYAFIGSVGVAWEFGYNSLVAGAAYVPPLVFAVIFLANYLKKKAYKMGSLSIPEYAGQIHNSAGVHAVIAVLNVLLMTVKAL
ncbi:MAG: hypothetical protein VB085_03765 [Peptococcaceae bacterium]|nr:hypothetical protein [Peptococcaceae bacterium]